MIKYNKQDVVLTERLYLKIRPWIANHPPIGIMAGEPAACNNCGSSRLWKDKRQFNYTKTGFKYQYKCAECGAYKTGSTLFKIEYGEDRLE